MSHRSTRLMSAASALALLPLTIPHTGLSQVSSAPGHIKPVTISVAVVTAIQPLNLSVLTQADFGDE